MKPVIPNVSFIQFVIQRELLKHPRTHFDIAWGSAVLKDDGPMFPSGTVFVLAPAPGPLGTLLAVFWRGPGSSEAVNRAAGVRGLNWSQINSSKW